MLTRLWFDGKIRFRSLLYMLLKAGFFRNSVNSCNLNESNSDLFILSLSNLTS